MTCPFVDLESGQLEVLHNPLGEHVARIIGDVILQDPTQQIAVSCDLESDGKDKHTRNER